MKLTPVPTDHLMLKGKLCCQVPLNIRKKILSKQRILKYCICINYINIFSFIQYVVLFCLFGCGCHADLSVRSSWLWMQWRKETSLTYYTHNWLTSGTREQMHLSISEKLCEHGTRLMSSDCFKHLDSFLI